MGIGLGELAGGSYEQVLNTLFIEPLGLSRTGLNTNSLWRQRGRITPEALRNDGAEVGFTQMGILDGAGEVLMSGEDMALFLRMMVRIDPYPVVGAVDRALTSLGAGEGMMDIDTAGTFNQCAALGAKWNYARVYSVRGSQTRAAACRCNLE